MTIPLTPRELADRWKVSEKTVRNLIRDRRYD